MTDRDGILDAKVKPMKAKTILLILVALLLDLSVSSMPAEAQPPIPTLPADLLFTTGSPAPGADFSLNMIMRVDAETLELSPFYVDAEAGQIQPIKWSPQGTLLAVYRLLPAIDDAYTLFPRQLCILDRAGALQRCMEDSPPMHNTGGLPDKGLHFPVVWGSDGQTIFFETEYPNEDSFIGYGRRIAEASVVTGQTLRVVYDYPESFPVTLSPDLKHISVGFLREFIGESYTFIRDLTTGIQVEPSTLVPAHTYMTWTCLPFSPSGQFIAVIASYNLSEYAPELVPPPDDYRNGRGSLLLLLDTQGTAQHVIGEPEGSPAIMWSPECPGWQPDEQAIVFYASNGLGTYIMRYTLADRQMITLYETGFEPGRETYVNAPFVLSPDGTHVALTVSDEPYGDPLVAVLYPDGNIYRIPSPYRFGLYPLWVPPVSAPPATPTPTPTETPTFTPTPGPVIFFDDFESGSGNWTATGR